MRIRTSLNDASTGLFELFPCPPTTSVLRPLSSPGFGSANWSTTATLFTDALILPPNARSLSLFALLIPAMPSSVPSIGNPWRPGLRRSSHVLVWGKTRSS